MPFLLFRITKDNWKKFQVSDFKKSAQYELQADALGDLRTNSNALKTWYIDDKRSNLSQVDLDLQSDKKIPPDNVLVDVKRVEEMGLKPVLKDGKWYIDNLLASKLIELSELIYSTLENS